MPDNFSLNTVQGKTYDSEDNGPGHQLWHQGSRTCVSRCFGCPLRKCNVGDSRLGQGSFRVLITWRGLKRWEDNHLIVRSLTPRISAACHHVIFLARARKITSCTFIVRSISPAEIRSMPSSGFGDSVPFGSKAANSFANLSGQLVC